MRIVLIAPLLLTACITSNPPQPAVRWFDPAPQSFPAPERAGVSLPVPQVVALPTVRQEFVVRIGERELAIDEAHRWSAAPDRLVGAALERGLFGPGAGIPGPGAVTVRVARFELDLNGPPRACIELHLVTAKGLVVCAQVAEAKGALPEQFAAAMAEALERVVVQARSALLAG